jgi:transposase
MSDRGYPVELRERVVAACVVKGMNQEEAAEVFSVGSATVYRWVRLHRENGSVSPRPHGGGTKRAFDSEEDQLLGEIVEEKPDRTIAELTAEICRRIGRTVSASAVVRSLKRLGLTLKKKSSRRSRRSVPTSRSAAPRSSSRSRA